MKKALIFDLDGTLADTLPICIESFQDALFAMTGKRPTENEVYAFFGYTEEAISKNLFPDDWENYFEHYIKIYEEKLIRNGKTVFKGVYELLDELKSKGHKIALVSAKGKVAGDLTLEYFEISHFFEYAEYGISAKGNKPENIAKIVDRWGLDPVEVYYVGDSHTDIRDAKEAGVNSIAAAWASTANVEKLKEHSPFLLFDNFEDFKNWALN